MKICSSCFLQTKEKKYEALLKARVDGALKKPQLEKTKLALQFGQAMLSVVNLMKNTCLHEDRRLFKWGFNKVSIAKAIYKGNLHRVLNK